MKPMGLKEFTHTYKRYNAFKLTSASQHTRKYIKLDNFMQYDQFSTLRMPVVHSYFKMKSTRVFFFFITNTFKCMAGHL